MAEMTEKQRSLFEAALAKSQVAEQQRVETPTQRMRTAAQGLTFGGADEAEAYLSSQFSGRPYDEVLAEVRGKLKAYQGARPMESLGYEIGGAAIPAIIGSLFTGGGTAAATAARFFPTLAKIAGTSAPRTLLGTAGTSAVQGGLTAFGSGEGGALERLSNVPTGVIAGGALGTGGELAGRVIKGAGVAVIDAARRRLGGRGAKAVETELQRLADESGQSIDEIVDRVSRGEIMAENATLTDAIRAYRAEGGKAAGMLRDTMTTRPGELRDKAMSEIQTYLGDVGDENVLRGVRRNEADALAAEGSAYAPFKTQDAPIELISEVSNALRRAPAAAEEVGIQYRANTGKEPFFTIENGTVKFNKIPTVTEAEQIRRAIQNRANVLYKGGMGGAGEATKDVESALRSKIDLAAPGMGEARQSASVIRNARDAFDAGRRALAKSPDEISIEFEDVAAKGVEAVKSYRAGVMDAYRTKMSTGQNKSLMQNLADPERKEGAILRIVMPQDEIEGILRKVETAAQSQKAAGQIFGQSPTAITSRQAQKIGSGVSLEDVAGAASFNPLAMIRIGANLIKKAAPQMSDAQRVQVMKILVSENPDLVKRALQDESGYMLAQQAVDRLLSAGKAGLQRGGAVGGSQLPGLLGPQ